MSNDHSTENDAPVIERVDRYTITVNGHRVRATVAQESTLRFLDASGVQRFLAAMGCLGCDCRGGPHGGYTCPQCQS